MDNQRLLLFVALSVIVALLWQAWQRDYGPHPTPPAPVQQAPVAKPGKASPPMPSAADIPTAPATTAAAKAAAPPKATDLLSSSGHVVVRTDVYRVVIDTTGGDLREVDLLKYPVSIDKPKQPIALLYDHSNGLFVAQSGLLASAGNAPDHHAIFRAAETAYELAPGQQELQVPLTWTGPNGVLVRKIYTFKRDSYVIGFEQRVTNNSKQTWTGRQYRQLQRTPPKSSGGHFRRAFDGAGYYSPDTKFEKIKFSAMEKAPLSGNYAGGWVAMIEHYFLGAWIPQAKQVNHYYTKALPGGRYLIGLISPDKTIAPGASAEFSSRLFVGPKLQDVLPKVAPKLELTVDYGWLTVVAQPLFWLLKWFHTVVGNWGVAIILLTVLIKLVFFKLSETSYRSMANMRKMGPRMKALRDRYGDDKQRLNQAMMEIYKKEKINPLGGCLPIVVQIPVFIALYWVLLGSVELRQAPFIFWIHDLSAKDPYYVMPIVMGITMVIQQRLNPAPPDPLQAKVMMFLPIVFTSMFLFFPAGLVLYWLVNNILSVAQQWYITRKIEKAAR